MTDSPTRIIVTTPTRDLAAFERLAAAAKRLKPYGQVELNVAASVHKLPVPEVDGKPSPWHEYTAYNPTLERFVPTPELESHVEPRHLQANRDLLERKREVLRKHGLKAAFWNYLPNYWPEAVFAEHPAWRGARSDHPRRSLVPAFSPCVDQPEVLQQYRTMAERLATLIPELGTLYFKTNDAGPGLCWSHWSYCGSNGPAACRGRTMGQRVGGLVEAVQGGASQAGVDLLVYFSGNFTSDELDDIERHLPARSAVRGRAGAPVTVSSRADTCYPVRGILDPLHVLSQVDAFKRSKSQAMFVDLRCSYDRGMEEPGVAEQMLDLAGRSLGSSSTGTRSVLDLLHGCCVEWVGPDRADALLECFVAMHEAFRFKAAALPKLSAIYGGVSMRMITRPLLFDPDVLAGDVDEDYFLPHIFNVSEHAARTDYLDQHGARLRPVHGPELEEAQTGDPRLWVAETAISRFESVANSLEAFGDTAISDVIGSTIVGLRLYSSILRSCAAFFAAGVLIERTRKNTGVKSPSDPWRGDADLAIFNELLRDEVDNAGQFLKLLRAGGTRCLQLASTDGDTSIEEDTFVLGADIEDQVARKISLTMQHWNDAEWYLRSPNR